MFLSYAREDSAAVQRLAEALRADGVEVWFDQNELVGGDAWDAKIRGRIATCVVFVPVISANTQARREGYFRLEWRLAAQRTHMMSERTAFLLPVVIDATREADADVPAEFKAVQWTRLPGGETTPQFVERIKRLLAPAIDGGRGRLTPPSPVRQPVTAGQATPPYNRASARSAGGSPQRLSSRLRCSRSSPFANPPLPTNRSPCCRSRISGRTRATNNSATA